MANRDLSSRIKLMQSISARALTATANGTGVDTNGYGSVVAVLDMGTFAGTTPTATVRLEESADDSTYTAVAAADLQGGALPAIDTTEDDQIVERGYIGSKQYVRFAVTAIAGTSASLPISGSFILGHAASNPA